MPTDFNFLNHLTTKSYTVKVKETFFHQQCSWVSVDTNRYVQALRSTTKFSKYIIVLMQIVLESIKIIQRINSKYALKCIFFSSINCGSLKFELRLKWFQISWDERKKSPKLRQSAQHCTGEWSNYAIISMFPHLVNQAERIECSIKENCLSRPEVEPGPLDCRSSVQTATPQGQLSLRAISLQIHLVSPSCSCSLQ